MAFITTAAFGEHSNNIILNFLKPYFINLVSKLNLKQFGFRRIYDFDLRKENYSSLKYKLRNMNIIFVNGGNTFFLLNWVRKSGLAKLILETINKGIIYIGLSAGSCIVCPTIEQITWKPIDKNFINLKKLKGLNLVPFLLIVHFKNKYQSTIIKESNKTKFPVVALNDHQAVLIENNKYKIIGEGDKIVFNDFKENY